MVPIQPAVSDGRCAWRHPCILLTLVSNTPSCSSFCVLEIAGDVPHRLHVPQQRYKSYGNVYRVLCKVISIMHNGSCTTRCLLQSSSGKGKSSMGINDKNILHEQWCCMVLQSVITCVASPTKNKTKSRFCGQIHDWKHLYLRSFPVGHFFILL